MIIGVIGKAVKAIVGGVSKGVGKKVEGHLINQFESAEKALVTQRMEQLGLDAKGYHAKNLADLKTETHLSGEWLQGLIKKSTSREELDQISQYVHFKTNTLPNVERHWVINDLNLKFQKLRDSEIVEKLLEFIKNHGEEIL